MKKEIILPDRIKLPEALIPQDRKLTKMEVVVLKSLLYGFDPQEIANEIFVSVRTIQNHVNNLHEKLKFHSSAAMIAAIYKNYLMKYGFNNN